jgi:uncharacterized membrane protein
MLRFISRALAACASGTVCALLAGVAHSSESDPSYETHFDSSAELSRWIVNAGSWSISGGRFVDGRTGPADIATVEHYDPDTIQWPTMNDDYAIDVYARVQNTGGSSVGVVYDFQDLANYHEVSFSATGVATMRSVIDGVARTVARGTLPGPGIGKWFHISVSRIDDLTRFKVDGQVAIVAFQRGLPQGDAGVIARNTRGQFDDFHVRDFTRIDPYTESFDDFVANRWQPLSGSWSYLRVDATTNVSYVNTTVNATSISLSPVTEMWDFARSPFAPAFTFKARMMNPYQGPGNLIGIAWVDSPQRYVEVVFSPRGQARINAVVNGRRTVLADAPYEGGGPNKWFEVEVAGNGDFTAEHGHVKVNGITVFDTLPRSDLRVAAIGLVSHWAPGAFDDVRASPQFFRPLSATMDDGRLPPAFSSPTSGWRVQNGTLNSFGVTANETARLDVFHDIADIEFRARMVNHYANAGNLVGLTYAYRGPDDYFEVVFSPIGVAKLNRVLKGMTTSVATASYSGGGQHQWFDVQLLQRRLRTTVKVNGVTVFNEVPQPDAGGAALGLVAHWAIANFDDIAVAQLQSTPTFRLTRICANDQREPIGGCIVSDINNSGEIVGSRPLNGMPQVAFLWRHGEFLDLNSLFGSNFAFAQSINDSSDVVGQFENAQAQRKGFLWQRGKASVIEIAPGRFAEGASHINNSREVVLSARGPQDLLEFFLWRVQDGHLTRLELQSQLVNATSPLGLNNRGTVVGNGAIPTPGLAVPLRWEDGKLMQLPLLRGALGGSAAAINDSGVVVGDAIFAEHAAGYRWQGGQPTELPSRSPAGLVGANPLAINNRGAIVGSGPTLWLGLGDPIDLNTLITDDDPLKPFVHLGTAHLINDRGEIVATGNDSRSPPFSQGHYLLTPLTDQPSPESPDF